VLNWNFLHIGDSRSNGTVSVISLVNVVIDQCLFWKYSSDSDSGMGGPYGITQCSFLSWGSGGGDSDGWSSGVSVSRSCVLIAVRVVRRFSPRISFPMSSCALPAFRGGYYPETRFRWMFRIVFLKTLIQSDRDNYTVGNLSPKLQLCFLWFCGAKVHWGCGL
jgi:hypothetical protein